MPVWAAVARAGADMTDAIIKAVMLALADAPPVLQAKVRLAIRDAQKPHTGGQV